MTLQGTLLLLAIASTGQLRVEVSHEKIKPHNGKPFSGSLVQLAPTYELDDRHIKPMRTDKDGKVSVKIPKRFKTIYIRATNDTGKVPIRSGCIVAHRTKNGWRPKTVKLELPVSVRGPGHVLNRRFSMHLDPNTGRPVYTLRISWLVHANLRPTQVEALYEEVWIKNERDGSYEPRIQRAMQPVALERKPVTVFTPRALYYYTPGCPCW